MKVKDDGGRTHELVKELGAGGQGSVYATQDERYVVKVLRLPDEPARERWLMRLNAVRALPLEDLNIARPIRLLQRPHVGYVMERVPGAQPLSALCHVPHTQPSPGQWYLETGGLRRRLGVLARTARLLGHLHSRGLVYGDPSPDNVLFSEEETVSLIDADNLRYASKPLGEQVLTPWFAAPEVYAGRSGVNSLTDAFAFAAMAFQTLTLVHPLLGDQVSAGEAEAEEAALRGEWPWIDHPQDDRNRSAAGLPRTLVLTPALRALAEQTFGDGLLDPLARPGLGAWEEALWEAMDRLLTCPSCSAQADHTLAECPWCGEKRGSYVLAGIQVTDQEVLDLAAAQGVPAPAMELSAVVVGTDGARYIQPRHFTGQAQGESHVELIFKDDKLSVRSLDQESYTLRRQLRDKDDVSVEQQGRPKRFPLAPGRSAWQLHLGSLAGQHRLVTFDLVEGTPL
ncbi:protein kinase domain-containing protein [Deinococcus petrolearius]|uniref:Protein kinase domain-containing protein n=1 Tax=Deinococcus petrolearius TaxID=1751295 RepID=A0ABW1DN50_9DEIO